MGAWMSQFLVRKEEYDTNDPASRMRIDLKYEENLFCHNYYASRAKYYTMELYGAVFGVLLTTLMKRSLPWYIRLAPFYSGMIVGIGIDMRRVENRCDDESAMCEQVINAHKMMIAAGHPPFAPIPTDFLMVNDADKWAHLRTPPLLLRRELIENWNYLNVNLPKERDEDELTKEEQEALKIAENAENAEKLRQNQPYQIV